MLKVVVKADSDETGELKALQVGSVDASAYGDETAALKAASGFMQQWQLASLTVTYGLGAVDLKPGDDLAKKADALFYESKIFDLNKVRDWNAPEWNLGEATRAGGSRDAAHAALRVSAKFGKKVSYTFNQFAGPAVEQKGPVTTADIDAANTAYVRAWQAKYAPQDLK